MNKQRFATQLTLGDLIDLLEHMDPDQMIQNLPVPHSYRGYYTNLAFNPSTCRVPVGQLLESCRGLIGETFEGYKGGEYTMDRSTPLWISDYGTVGERIMAINLDGSFETEEDLW